MAQHSCGHWGLEEGIFVTAKVSVVTDICQILGGHNQCLKPASEHCCAKPGSSQAEQMQAAGLMLGWLPLEGPSWTLQDLALQSEARQSRWGPLFKV